MAQRMRRALVVTTLGMAAAGVFNAELTACGDKFLVAGRGTRYQRPKTARAASVLIYADPLTSAATALRNPRLEAALKHEGHRLTFVDSSDQLAALLTGGRYDVVLTLANVAPAVEQLVTTAHDAAVVVALDAQPRGRTLVEAIDRAVEQRDRNVRRSLATS